MRRVQTPEAEKEKEILSDRSLSPPLRLRAIGWSQSYGSRASSVTFDVEAAEASCYKSRHFSPADRRRRRSETRREKGGEYSGLEKMDQVIK
ncbi:hypothetical protein AMELA_G00210540 [Ameiurus melas]|uniref:Uncharacterized protein n=1 Tax=Ameiurus melas TaxID=219545 RepID=A0A7J6A4J1_AMEME|nr:hypothetical protein AMELA_G00210540 [Ameiurus melas]